MAVRLANPYPSVPDELMARMKPGSTGVIIRAEFRYKRENGGALTAPGAAP